MCSTLWLMPIEARRAGLWAAILEGIVGAPVRRFRRSRWLNLASRLNGNIHHHPSCPCLPTMFSLPQESENKEGLASFPSSIHCTVAFPGPESDSCVSTSDGIKPRSNKNVTSSHTCREGCLETKLLRVFPKVQALLFSHLCDKE